MVETCASENLLADLLAPGRSFSRSRSLVSTQMKVNSQARQEVSFVANSATTETTKSNSSGFGLAPPRLGQGESHVSEEAVEGLCGGPRAAWPSSAGLRGVHWQFIWEEISVEFKRPRPCLPDGTCCVSWGGGKKTCQLNALTEQERCVWLLICLWVGGGVLLPF